MANSKGKGRQKGTRNRKTQELEAEIKKLGCEPFKAMALIASQTENVTDDEGKPVYGDDGKILKQYVYPTEQRISCMKELASYIRPKLKSTEFKSDDDMNYNFTINNFNEDGSIANGDQPDITSQLGSENLPN